MQNQTYEMHPQANPRNILTGKNYRITLLTDSLIRFEYSPENYFEDRASQRVWFRDLGEVSYTKECAGSEICIRTDALTLRYEEGENFLSSLLVDLRNPERACEIGWNYGKKGENLFGTGRTLDTIDGEMPLEDGILSMDGFAVMDDSETVLLEENGWLGERRSSGKDFYLFAYGHDYRRAIQDFYKLTGPTPMIPKYALGNWWSRYYKYTEQSYMELMERFQREQIPFSVAVIDMDWHLVDIDPKYGNGWTGFTWNKEFFPDPERFMKWLHDRGMKITLNLHPASGIRAFEEMYERMAVRLGIDPATEQPIPFDFTNPEFIRVYFEEIHHMYEDQGVDFWWIDWQQGSYTKIKGLDPLWLLNHFYYLDNGRTGKRPMIFSRYAGPGSHRYPIGFSGDTIMSWASLQFQPYFTYTASNIGYGWWSHDIGGHMMGYTNDVMAARWYQFGVFSPINRLHSCQMEFMGKEPWNFRTEVRNAMCDALRVRHQMIPYLYTLNYHNYSQGRPMISPMYYDYPEVLDAYPGGFMGWGGFRNQYMMGSELLVAPIVTDLIREVNMGKVKIWLPEGIWHDFFTGVIYQGGKVMELYRGLDSIPVLAKAGAILPLLKDPMSAEAVSNPAMLEIRVYGGADGSFELYEDDNESCAYQDGICVKTPMSFVWEEGRFTIHGAAGNLELIPERRNYIVKFMGIAANEAVVTVNGEVVASESSYASENGCLTVILPEVAVDARVEVTLKAVPELNDNHVAQRVYQLLQQAQIDNYAKEAAFLAYCTYSDPATVLSQMKLRGVPEETRGAMEEIMTAKE